ncbi:YHS domain-containing (seleno)protein [Sediminibacterium sp. KACHI17]|jgi:YHS domain-containing protein|uniref:YHS domain-containing (Seleno)protein n=1 Tax=Sediminibacterium sp. KACHI17 TaxID=1751071 RepID=A0AAT9GH74_9BACT
MKKIIGLLLISLISSTAILAQQSEIFTINGKAIRGYDVVAFFTASKPVKGEEQFSHVWKNTTWLFSSLENQELFKSNPEKYAPQYGGYCAFGMSGGYKAPTIIETWKIIDQKLYFNYSLKVQDMWNKDISGHIIKADYNWQKIKNQ